MRCSECGFENPEEFKFCGKCGSQLLAKAICPGCEAEVDAELSFCGFCGQKTAEDLPDASLGAIESTPVQIDINPNPVGAEPAKKFKSRGKKAHKQVLKWATLSVALVLVATGAVAGLLLPQSNSTDVSFEEATEIYALQADSPTQIGDYVKTSESDLTDGLEDMGAVRGKILEYSDDGEKMLIMAFVFGNTSDANRSFQELYGEWLDDDFYLLGSDGGGNYSARLIDNVIYLVSGDINDVVMVTDAVSATIPTKVSPPVGTASSSGEVIDCYNIDLSEDFRTFEYTRLDHECDEVINMITSSLIRSKCKSTWGAWRGYWVKELDVSAINTIRVQADLSLIDHVGLFDECGGNGVKYDNYALLMVIDTDPVPVFSPECGGIAETDADWGKCNIPIDDPTVLGYCGVPQCSTSQLCDFQVDVSNTSNIYLVWRVADAWDYADVEASLSNLRICTID